jgi:hypothetical protein
MDAILILIASWDAPLVITMMGLQLFGIVSLVMTLALLQDALEAILRTVLVVTQLGRD